MKLQIKCFNLHRRPDRKFSVTQSAPPELLDKIKFVEAIDGRLIRRSRLAKWKIAPSAYAINLCKRLALRAFLRSDDDALLILEDDVCFEPGFLPEMHRLLAQVPGDWGMLFLGGGHLKPVQQTEVPGLVRCGRVHYNHAWIIHRRCARTLIHALSKKPFAHPCSDQTIGALQQQIPTYAASKWIAFQRRGLSDNGFGVLHRPMRPLSEKMRPWMHDDEIAVLQCAIKPGMRVLEWGSGGSTLLAAQCVGKQGWMDSIEHEQDYAQKVTDALRQEAVDSWTKIHVVPPDFGSGHISSARPRQFCHYTRKALELGDSAEFDACIIDGRNRIACALTAARVLRPGGHLFFHDFAAADRSRYREWLPELLNYYELLFEITHTPQTMSVFRRRSDTRL